MVLSVASLRKRFDDRCRLRAVEAKAAITEPGLVLGAGTLLVRMGRDRFGLPMLALAHDEERAHTLLTVAHWRPPPADLYRHLQSAAEYWRGGDKALANLRLAFARLSQLESELDAWRLYLAAELLDEGVSPRRLLRELGYESGEVHKYDPEEARVPAGNGRESGEWSSGKGGSSIRDIASVGSASRGSLFHQVGDVIKIYKLHSSEFKDGWSTCYYVPAFGDGPGGYTLIYGLCPKYITLPY